MSKIPPFVRLCYGLIVGGWFVGVPAGLVYGRDHMDWPSALLSVWGITAAIGTFAVLGVWHTERWVEKRRGEKS